MDSKEVIIKVEGLSKTFKIPEKTSDTGLISQIKSVLIRKWNEVEVLKDINFTIHKGEFIGYIGANGAGKSTTIKLLTGILHPDKGKIQCLNFNPYKQRYEYTYHLGVVFGQKSILEYEIPVRASFDLYREIYELNQEEYHERLDFFNRTLNLNEFMHIPVRKLSFGQRMRCEIAASLLHNPEIVFLDEPTIGLDAKAKKEIRDFLKTINHKQETTIILTTHDMKDIEALCERVIMIDKGSILFDGQLNHLRSQFAVDKSIHFKVSNFIDEEKFNQLKQNCHKTTFVDTIYSWHLNINQHNISDFCKKLMSYADLEDLHIQEQSLEDIVENIYENGLSY